MPTLDPRDLVNSSQIAERLGLAQRETVHQYVRRYSRFPEPVYAQGKVMLWDWRQVHRWATGDDQAPAGARATAAGYPPNRRR